MAPTINLGPLVLPTAGILYIFGAWVVLNVIERAAKALHLNGDYAYGLAATALISGFLGARMIFVVLHWSAYRVNLIGIIWPITGGYDFWGGFLFAVLGAVLYGRSKRLPIAETLDALTPGLLVGLLVVSLADLLSGPGYGTESSMPWALEVFGIWRHPVQIYEILVALAALLVWLLEFKHRQFAGQLFLISTAVYAAGRLFVDAFRANSPLTMNGYHIVQLVSLGAMLISIFLLSRLATRNDESTEIITDDG